MGRYALKRLAQGAITVWFIATATFFAMHMVPGDPLASDKAVSEKIRANLEAKYGLDMPLLTQYGIYMANLARGDFGISFTQENRRVNDIIREHFPVSATLGILAVVFAALGGILWGALTALNRNRMPDIVIMLLVIPRHIGAEFRVRRPWPACAGEHQRPARFSLLPVAGWAPWPICWRPRWCWASAPWPTSPG